VWLKGLPKERKRERERERERYQSEGFIFFLVHKNQIYFRIFTINVLEIRLLLWYNKAGGPASMLIQPRS
jgi:hypothetical protein